MGTRGLIGFHSEGINKVTYNHFDSYPSGLGYQAIKDTHKLLEDPEFKQKVDALQLVNEESKPTAEQITALKKYFNPNVSTGSEQEWYALLRDVQGDVKENLKCGYMIDSEIFAKSSLFCEWGYVINLDTEQFEVYQGFQKEDHGAYGVFQPFTDSELQGEKAEADELAGKFGHDRPAYYPIKLIGTISFETITKDLSLALNMLDMIATRTEEEGEAAAISF